MARWKRDEILKQRISEAAGVPIGDICAQDSRCFVSKLQIVSTHDICNRKTFV